MTKNELQIWLEIIIVMGVYNIARPRDCWAENGDIIKYSFVEVMTRERFQNIECLIRGPPPSNVKHELDTAISDAYRMHQVSVSDSKLTHKKC
ncbi:hypothetical protein P3T76_014123 [Phytophthora citrophthora]|uniref:PiggyBac transposable element-derived protein domain-containing protein n=1 Tax=Phytophthora citrophthora TaxID=4793 RepID=A0AAD9G1X2_9STRA|nr:hypothetical protein P3T76_014123 [Phytophthora citrophthora]